MLNIISFEGLWIVSLVLCCMLYVSLCYASNNIILFTTELGDIGLELPSVKDFGFVNHEIKILKVNIFICKLNRLRNRRRHTTIAWNI